MSEDSGAVYVTVEDEEGNEFELEKLASIDYSDKEYVVFLPADMKEDDPDYGYIILRIVEENGEELYDSIDDDEELKAVYDRFMETLFVEEADGDEDEETDQ